MTIEIKSKEIKMLSLAQLKPYHKNRNIHDKAQIEDIAYLIKANGFRDPLAVCEDTMQVITGNGTLEACILLGMTEVPCDVQKFASEAERYAYSVSHNVVSKRSKIDMAGINLDLPEFGPDEFEDFKVLGFEDFKLDPSELLDMPEDKTKAEKVLKHCPHCGGEI